MKINSIIFTVLILGSISSMREFKHRETPFERALRLFREVNTDTENYGAAFYYRIENKTAQGIPTIDFVAKVKSLFGDVQLSENPFVYEYDLNNNGFIDEHESGLAFRNIVISLARDVAFNGLKYSAPAGENQTYINFLVSETAKKYMETKNVVDQLFGVADIERKGLLSTEKFLSTFNFPETPSLKNILASQNPSGAEKINKEQAFYIFGLLVLENQKEEEGKVKVAGAEAEHDFGKHFLQGLLRAK
jgi:hypothetical protein